MVDRFTITAAEQDPWIDADPSGQWVRYSDYAALEAELAEAKASLHIATSDKLSLLEQLDTERQRLMAQIDYSCDLQHIIEDLCRGGPVREPKTSARRHYDMATAFLSALEAQLAERVKVMDRLVKLAEKRKAYHKAKQNEFPSIEQCVDEDGAFRSDQNLYGLLQGEAANGRYSEADWWLCTIRAETTGLSALEAAPAPMVTEAMAARAIELSVNTGELIDKMAEAIRGDTTSDDTPWATLSEDRKVGWRGDAERALAVVKEYLTARRPSEQAVTEAMELARAVLAQSITAGHNVPGPTPEDIEKAFWALDAALTASEAK